MKCPACGHAEIPDAASECPNCGAALKTRATVTLGEIVQGDAYKPYKDAVAVAFLVLLAILFILGRC
ncbi:MAG: zinc ribbon domain-containing protein [Calditrichaeota bacterium]|nr:zinc ribbon domain-containing protein [Calditrichota bacterium]